MTKDKTEEKSVKFWRSDRGIQEFPESMKEILLKSGWRVASAKRIAKNK